MYICLSKTPIYERRTKSRYKITQKYLFRFCISTNWPCKSVVLRCKNIGSIHIWKGTEVLPVNNIRMQNALESMRTCTNILTWFPFCSSLHSAVLCSLVDVHNSQDAPALLTLLWIVLGEIKIWKTHNHGMKMCLLLISMLITCLSQCTVLSVLDLTLTLWLVIKAFVI